MTFSRRLAVIAPSLIALSLATALPAASQEVVARVNGKDITSTEVELGIDVFGAQLQQVPEGARKAIVLDALIDMHVMADAARAAGLAENAKFKERMSFLEAQALRNTSIEEKIQNAVSDADLKARYEKDVSGYTPPEEVRARHILVKTKEEADQVIADLAAGGDFAAIAAEKSLDPGSKTNGGDLGFFGRGQMVPAFEEEAFRLAPGETSKAPVESQFGFHVIKVEEKRSQPVPTFDEVRDQVAEVLQREKFQEVLGTLKSEARIEMLTKDAAPATQPAPAPAQ